MFTIAFVMTAIPKRMSAGGVGNSAGANGDIQFASRAN
jgi:hypothetical protein